jgi:pimeloyl-ACP methyl ester carboxylesterase
MALPDPQHLHTYCMDTLMAGPSWTSAYSAAMRYPAMPAVSRVGAPLTFSCRANDVLFRYLDDLPDPLPAGCTLERLSGDPEEWRHRLRGLLAQYARHSTPSGSWTPPDPFARTSPRGETRGYVDHPRGQVHVRVYGTGDRPPLLLLHETPGSSRQLAALARALAGDRMVIVPDLPGTGESGALPHPDMANYRDAMLAVLDRFAPTQADIHAEFTAGPLALELARSAPGRIRRLSVDGAFMPGRAECRRLWRDYCPKLTPRWDGTHLLSAWHRMRDQELNWPWYESSADSVRRREPDLDAQRLNDQVVDLLKQPNNYGDAALAAFEYRVRDVLTAITQPVLLLQEPTDVRSQWTEGMQRRLPDVQVIERPRDGTARAQAIRAFLDRRF